MTRDEAIKTASAILQRRFPATASENAGREYVDVLAALGVLKLESESDWRTGLDDEVLRFESCIREQGLDYEILDGQRIRITTPTTELQRELIDKHRGAGWIIDYASVRRCEPPPEHQDKTFHWLRLQEDVEVKLAVHEWRENKTWEAVGLEAAYTPKELSESGWRYVAPCLPPEMPR